MCSEFISGPFSCCHLVRREDQLQPEQERVSTLPADFLSRSSEPSAWNSTPCVCSEVVLAAKLDEDSRFVCAHVLRTYIVAKILTVELYDRYIHRPKISISCVLYWVQG